LLNTPLPPVQFLAFEPGPSPTADRAQPAAATPPPPPSSAADVAAQLLAGTCGLVSVLRGRRVLDLGSGTGLAGLAAAACGAHVLLTDLPSVCERSLQPNLQRNAASDAAGEAEGPSDAGLAAQGAAGPAGETTAASGPRGPWPRSLPVGPFGGSAAVMPLDWTEPLGAQAASGGCDPHDAELLLACDTIWLGELFGAFVALVAGLLAAGRGRACLLAFVERAGEGSQLFVRKEAVPEAFAARGCTVRTLVAEDVGVDGVPRPGRVLCITCG
jgi:predicted nicotinamide N-methyase